MNKYPRLRDLLVLLLLTVFAMLIQGYHPGAEDDGVYLAAIKRDLNPHLYPRDFQFFKVQLQATIFDKLVAYSIRLTHLPIAWAALIWQVLSILLVLWTCLRIARFCFQQSYAHWAGVGLVAALLALPVTGTGLYLMDEHLHPRSLATGAILLAVIAVLEGRQFLAGIPLLIAVVIHPIMAAFGISYCIFLYCCLHGVTTRPAVVMAAFMPLNWIFEPVTPLWKQAAASRHFYFLAQWRWYEWLGVFAPMLLLWWFSRIGKRNGSRNLEKIGVASVYYGVFQLVVSFIIMVPTSLMRLWPLQPMRYLQLIYIVLALLGGGLLGQKLLRTYVYRWIVLFVPLCGAMLYAQRQLYRGTMQLELPGRQPKNNWLQAFAWIRANTPQDAYFAIDPYYMKVPGEDYHSFRALAERSVMADAVKDPSVVTQVPRLAPEWKRETDAESGWKHFDKNDFERLQKDFGVTWAVIAEPGVAGMDCPYRNATVLVCKLN